GRFGGTSHSCPVVAGVAALVLSADQSLTYLEVFDILTATADEVGGYTYTNGWSEELGYGRVNACRSVLEAFSGIMSVTGPSIVCTSNSTFTLHNRPSGTTVNWTKSSNLSYVSGQGTDNYTVKAYSSASGTGWVQAAITVDCGNVTIRYNIDWVGKVLPLDIRLIDRTTGMPKYVFCLYQANPVQAKHDYGNPHIDDWDWYVSGGHITYDNPYEDNS
ncbi:unnamed protein product, partial [marine sediment metagenome]